MPRVIPRLRISRFAASSARYCLLVLCAATAVALAFPSLAGVNAQQVPAPDQQPAAQPPAPAQSSASTPAPSPDSQPPAAPPAAQPPANQPPQTPPAPATAPAPPAAPQETQPSPPAENAPAPGPAASQPAPAASQKAPSPSSEPNEITEDEIKTLLVGKQLFLRGGYLDDDLSYNENGVLVGHSPQASYTLSAIEIDKIHLTKHKLELEGQRFGLHFLGALPYEDPTKAVDRVNITPKKKVVKITIDRELVVKPKEKKEKEKGKASKAAPKVAAAPAPASSPAPPAAAPAATAPAPTAASTATPAPAPPAESTEASNTTDEAQAEIAAAPPAERPADAKSVTTTTSQAHSNKLLRDALGNVFAQGFDSRMMDAMPEFWKLYYAAAAAKTDYQPADPNVLRQSMVDKKARLVSTFEPASNQYAQDHGVAGICLYHVVIGADGKPGEIAVGRPIGFGLDENAVDAIRKATFEPAIKDSKPVPVLLNLVVEFRIYSQRTAVTANPSQQPPESSLPGPYSVQH
ncbi:MAG: energy transducer TonB [Terracidiphilus sp.]